MILENNEEKRSTLWRTVLTVSSVIIIIVAAFFIIKLFTSNPLEGTWVSEDSGAMIEIGDDGEMTMTGMDAEGTEQDVTAEYFVDTKNKIFTIQTEAYGQAEGVLSGSYDYNVEQDTLTLTEREYGDQMVFVREE
ncbi:hypothetical protein LKD70_04930 [Ruminococcus sp. CLA-AA-H200]|uniref:DUF5640 domain-containing protein n=1 Tax=Ruminococcus turbiniformis TaxID=2881258 RepID=A0ABS8FWQ1_9FIRM|nr:hypothetical protein [Ruminococcus turbiniformis]MCC2253783.1 hypothetical protein [Ruminococcus turbiniformis]